MKILQKGFQVRCHTVRRALQPIHYKQVITHFIFSQFHFLSNLCNIKAVPCSTKQRIGTGQGCCLRLYFLKYYRLKGGKNQGGLGVCSFLTLGRLSVGPAPLHPKVADAA